MIYIRTETNILTKGNLNQAFNEFYQGHIQKLLVARSAQRYLAKANYNITRLEYLLDLNASSKFIIMVRDPVMHVKSILRQDKIFSKSHSQHPKTLKFMEMSGHYEFGLNKKLINVDADELKLIKQKFNDNDDIYAWSLYWNMIYKYVISTVDNVPTNNVMLCRYEDLCDKPSVTIDKICNFADLSPTEIQVQEIIQNIRPLTNQHSFDDRELDVINSVTQQTAEYFGY